MPVEVLQGVGAKKGNEQHTAAVIGGRGNCAAAAAQNYATKGTVVQCTMYIQCIVRLRGIHILYFRVHAVTLRIVQECPDAKVCARAVIAPR